MKADQFPLRQIHLDFHTSPDISDVGADWDADEFARTLVEARVNSINIFAKCHHGMNYYPSKIGPVHPALKFDLLGEQIEACHRVGIHCPIYFSICWDMSAAERHPEWRQVDKDGRLVGRGPFESNWGWPWLCMNTDYAEEIAAQTEELLSLYECDGFWYDIVMYHNDGCLCPRCFSDLRRAGKDPQNPLHRLEQNNASARRLMGRLTRMIRGKFPAAAVFYNGRMGYQLEDEVEPYAQVEIESLPTGGWGYGFYPFWSRFARNFGRPMVGMTGRFHRGWADWGGRKHPDALRFECGGILASGGAPCVGDQMHPRGRLNKAVYEVIGEAFRDVEAVEPYCHGAEAVPQIAVLVLRSATDRAIVGGQEGGPEGAARMLLELHQQFDVITGKCQDFSRYEALVIPDGGEATPEVAARLRAYVAHGGKLLVAHEALLDRAAGRFHLGEEMGVDYLGPCASNPDYWQIADPRLATDVTRPGFPYSYYNGPSVRVRPRPGTETLADAYETYFNRTWEHFTSHGFTPALAQKANYPAVTRRGDVVYLHGPVFGAYQQYGNLAFRALVGQCLRLLVTAPVVETDAPSTTEVTLLHQGARRLVHLVNYSATRRATPHVEVLERPVPLRDVTLRVRGAGKVSAVKLARAGLSLPFQTRDGTVSVTVPRVDVHEIVVIE